MSTGTDKTQLIITWQNNGFVQVKNLVHCREGRQGLITMNSPIYEAIANGSFCLNLGFGEHKFSVKQI